jgi:hypothetical protein
MQQGWIEMQRLSRSTTLGGPQQEVSLTDSKSALTGLPIFLSAYVIVMTPDTRDRVSIVLIIACALFMIVDVMALLLLAVALGLLQDGLRHFLKP